ncbi:MAG: ELM1/GtrOC1 family putative glycosyltransferase [Pseudomonadota bacterium]
MKTKPRDLRIGVLVDGRDGHRAQALALAEALGRIHPAEIREEAAPRSALPAHLSHLMMHIGIGRPRSLFPEGWADLVISAGRRAAPALAALGQDLSCPVVQILWPGLPRAAFTRLILPQHDRRPGQGVIETIGAMGRLTAAQIEEAAAALSAPGQTPGPALGPEPHIAMLLGGPSRSAGFDSEGVFAALTGLAGQYPLWITPSRRTPQGLAVRLRSALPDAFVWDGMGPNPYPALLHGARAVLVTADSVNMASEAASTGTPVHVLQAPKLAPKLHRFHESLAAHGAARPFRGTIEQWSYTPLAEADRVAALLWKELDLSARLR